MVGNKTTNGTVVPQVSKVLDQNLAPLSRKFPELIPEESLTNVHPFVRFAWSGNLYEFLCLCFGLGPAPRIFSKLLKVPIALQRWLNICLVIYLDVILLMGRTEEILMRRDTLIFLLPHLGFVINLKKSVLKPSQQIELGLKIDTHTITLALTEEKIEKVILKCQNLLSHPQTTVLELTKFIGLMSSTVQAVLPKVFTTKTNTITILTLFISGRDSIKQFVKTGTSLVGGKFKIKQWKITKAKGTKFSDTNRCIEIRFGSHLERGFNWGKMVRKGGELTYKCSGINSSQVCDSNIHKRTIKYSNSLADRQQDCTFICFENGGYTQQRTLAHQQVHLELPSQQTNRNVCGVPSPCSKCTCRLGITKCQ